MTDPRAERRRAQQAKACRLWRQRHPGAQARATARWKAQNQLAARAHQAVKRAVARGDLTRPDRCEACDARCVAQAHHDDYTKPLDVDWLCPPCHAVADGKTAKEAA